MEVLEKEMGKTRRFYQLQLMRAAIASAITIFLTRVADLGTNETLLVLAALLGTWIAGRMLLKGRSFLGALLTHAVLFVGVVFILWFTNLVLTGADSAEATKDFYVYRLAEHLTLLGIFYAASFLTTWYFWCARQAVTVEATLFAVVFLSLLSGHRNYHLDAPKKISELAWQSGLPPEQLILGLAAGFTVFLWLYLVLAGTRPLFSGALPLESDGSVSRLLRILIPTGLLLALFGYTAYVGHSYNNDMSRATNGVGENKEQGQSPLGFHSAIGQTKQPAALVRLEGDYAKNPWSPMLYLREGALSEFNGKELVNASREYDTDVPRIQPGQPYISIESEPGPNREKITQSIYLLTKHSSPFAIDFPRSMRLIKNPDPERFQLAYQALSYAPTIKVDEIVGEDVGDSNWTDAMLKHYLRAPGSISELPETPIPLEPDKPVLDKNGEDLRYAELSRELTKDAESPVLKASLISKYLSEKSIYTRNPGHQVTGKGDPVAPYLFSEKMRGYCVHFAHSAVYLMRLAGIPARIGTGYLTDLTYAKDGHILLHLGDRHAWPEIYVKGQGWVVLDVTPAQAENEQVIVPDEKLLEELMSKIDPAQDLVTPPPPEPEEEKKKENILDKLAKREVLLPVFALLISAWLLVKFWLRFGYRFARDDTRRVQLAYTSVASLLCDLGLSRRYGETRHEYAARLRKSFGVDAERVTSFLEKLTYRGPQPMPASGELHEAITQTVKSYDEHNQRWKRPLAFLSPVSVGRWRRW